jgi:diguanylate cyclase (GGDEF)-like protein
MSEAHLSLLYFDLDHFKAVNDQFGHEVGDEVLKSAGRMLNKAVRKGDSVIRWGGEEFIVILPTADPREANEVINRIMALGLGETPDQKAVTASIGVAEVLADEIKDWKTQVELADHRMYMAKSNGRARSMGVGGDELLWPAA